jgi:hypothetical protein
MPVGVDDADHDLVGAPALHEGVVPLEQLVQDLVALVQDRSLAAACDLGRPVDDEHAASRLECTRPLGGLVRRSVVDDDHAIALVVEADQVGERSADDDLLVVGRDDQCERGTRPASRIPARRKTHREKKERHVVQRDERHEVAQPGDVDAEHQRGPGTQRK